MYDRVYPDIININFFSPLCLCVNKFNSWHAHFTCTFTSKFQSLHLLYTSLYFFLHSLQYGTQYINLFRTCNFYHRSICQFLYPMYTVYSLMHVVFLLNTLYVLNCAFTLSQALFCLLCFALHTTSLI